ncbi:TPA: right-handed parallel beta-helix repeat-containing protein [Streptococcus suis]
MANEYDFRDLKALIGEEALDNENYYRDPTPVDNVASDIANGKKDSISVQLATWLRQKKYGIDVRETLARFIEWISVQVGKMFVLSESVRKEGFELALRQGQLEERLDRQIGSLTDDSEVIDARGYHSTLGARLDAMKMKRVINIADLPPGIFRNAYIDGINDDSVVVQAVVDYLHKLGGGTILLPVGDIVFTKTVKWKPGVSLVGHGPLSRIVMKGELFDAISANLELSTFGDDGLNDDIYLTDCVFSDFQIDGSGLTHPNASTIGKGMFMLYLRRCHFERLWIRNTIGTGLGCDFLDNCTIDRCIVENCGRNRAIGPNYPGQSGIGIGQNGSPEEALSITNCICRNNGLYGIFVEAQYADDQPHYIRSRGTRIANNYLYGNDYGFSDKGIGGVIFEGNQVYNNRIGVSLSSYAQFDQILGNRIEGNTQIGLVIDGTHKGDILIADNLVMKNRKAIHIMGGVGSLLDLQIVNNQIKDNEFFALEITRKVSNMNLEGNLIKNNNTANQSGSKQAIKVDGGLSNFTVTNNTFLTGQSQRIGIEIKLGISIENGIIANNNFADYSGENALVRNGVNFDSVELNNNIGLLNVQTGISRTVSDGTMTTTVDFPTVFAKRPRDVRVYLRGYNSRERLWVAQWTSHNFFVRSDSNTQVEFEWVAEL